MNRSSKVPNSTPQRLRVAAVQMIFADSIAGNLEKIERAALQAAADGADAVLFPECATTGYACDFGALKPAAIRQALCSVAEGFSVFVGAHQYFANRKQIQLH